MKRVNIDLLIGSGAGTKETDKADMRLYRILLKDFSALKSFWAKAFFIFLLERTDNKDLRCCGKKLHFEMRLREKETYDRYIHHYIVELKRDFFKSKYDNILDNITDSLISFGESEFVILNKIIFNCTDKFKFNKVSYTKDMRTLIETYYI